MEFTWLSRWQPQLLAILRIIAALLLLEHGLMKIFHFPAPQIAGPLPPLLVAAAAVCAAMSAVLLTLTLVVMFWEEHRVAVLGLLTLLFASGAGALVWTVRRRLLRWQAFAASREQLKKDCACFGTGN